MVKISLEEFISFVEKTIEELILYASVYSGKNYEGYELTFKWNIHGAETVRDKENIVYEIADKVYLSPEKIYPCVDLVIGQTTNENILQISGSIAGYEPRPFGIGWSGRPGPFIYGIGKGIISGLIKNDTKEIKQKLINLGLAFPDTGGFS